MSFTRFTRVVAVLLSIGCGAPADNPDEAATIAAIQRLGGKIESEGEGSSKSVIKVYLHNTKVQDADLERVGSLKRLRNLFLGNTSIGDEGLRFLSESIELQTLSLNSTNVTDAGLESLNHLSKLKTLNLQETKTTAGGANKLKKTIPGVKVAR